MFRKFAQVIGSALRNKSPSAPPPPTPLIPVQPTIYSVLKEAAAAKGAAAGKNAEKSQALASAHQDLQAAVKELSLGSALPVTSPPVETLKEWQHLSQDELTVEQAEELARVYFEGSNGLEEDKKKALDLWKFAADRGSIEGKYSRALCLKDGVGIEKNSMTAYEELLELSEKKNYHLAHYSLAVMLDKGDGIPSNPEKAFHHYMQAALGGVVPAVHNIANAFATGRGVGKDERKALLYYEAGAEGGDPYSCFSLGVWYYQGRAGLEADPVRSFQLQLKAAQQAHPAAMFNVGTALITGDGTDKDPKLAAEWLAKAASANVPHANLNLAKMYMDGTGVDQDLEKAAEILQPVLNKIDVAKQLLDEIEFRKANPKYRSIDSAPPTTQANNI